MNIQYEPLSPSHFERLITLANHVHGDNYLDGKSMQNLYEKSFCNSINASFVSLIGDKLIGFRLTVAAHQWQDDELSLIHI